jgi:hypothetical protein
MATRKIIKVLSVKQPWATLLLMPGAKEFETRSMLTNYRGELYIHATKRVDFDALELCYQDKHFNKFIPDPTKLINGAIIGRVQLVNCFHTEAIYKDLTPQERAFGNYMAGRYAWQCAKPELFKKPILNVGGLLGIWNYEIEVQEDEDRDPYALPNADEYNERMINYQKLK